MTIHDEKAKEILSTESRSTSASAAAEVRAPEAPRTRAQQLLQSERERLRSIESTLTELMQELAAELSSSESRLQQLEGDLGERNNEVDDLRSELELWKQACDQRAEKLHGTVVSDLPPEELARKLADTELALVESQQEQQELRGQLAKAHKQLNLRAQELNDLRAQLVEASMKRGETPESSANFTHEMLDLRSERQLLVQRLADAENQLQQFAQIDISEVDHLRRRFELAVQDVRELKVKNSQLESELAKLKAGAPVAKSSGSGDTSDWEARKKVLLAQLESDFSDADPSQKKERLTIEGTLRITDDVVAQKEREIRELRQTLAERSGGLSEGDIAANALAEIVDKDELVLQAREKLRKLEVETSEKLRRAEVEISVERAKLARERSMLDERLRALEKERSQNATAESEASASDKPVAKVNKGGRWLARLGLKDDKS